MSTSARILDAGVLATKLATPEPGDCPYTLLLGAGASVSSGIPTVDQMVKDWKIELFRDQTGNRNLGVSADDDKFNREYSEWEAESYDTWREEFTSPDDKEYGALFGHFYQHAKERQMYIEKVVDVGHPTFGYLYLAGLIHGRRLNRVLTTNFDDLLNDALTRYYETKPIVCAFDSAVAGIRIASRRPKIIKLHGDFLYDNIKNVRHELKALDTNMEEKLYELCKDSGLIVVGYRGDDESVMAPIRDMLRKPNYLNLGIHWCVYTPNPGEYDISEELERLVSNHRDRVHLYKIESFDRLMEELFVRCECSLPRVLVKPQEHNPPAQFFEAIRRGSSAALSPRMVKDLDRIVLGAAKRVKTPEQYVREAEVDWEKGKTARKSGRIDEVKMWFRSGLARLDSLFEKSSLDEISASGAVLALRRRAGLQIGLAKLELASDAKPNAEFDQYLADAIENVKAGVALVDSERGTEIVGTLRTTFYYQGCCALGVKMKAKGKLGRNDLKLFDSLIASMKARDTGGGHLGKLLADSDFEPLLPRFNEKLGSGVAKKRSKAGRKS